MVFETGGGDGMKVHIVTGRRDVPKEGQFIVGVFSSSEEASFALNEAKEKMGNQFSFFTETRVLNQRIRYHGSEKEEDNDDISLLERLEALEQYMSVAQQKIIKLEAHLGVYHNYAGAPSTEELKRQWQILVDSQTGRNK